MSTLKTTNISHPNSAANDIVLDANGSVNVDSGTFYVDATNNRVGIGTTSPATALHVSGSGTQRVRITGTGSANAILTLDAPSGFTNYIEYGASTSTPLAFYDVANTAERARIDSSGRLLVGTSSTSAASTVVIQGNSASSTGNSILRLQRGDTTLTDGGILGGVYLGDSTGTQSAEIEARRDGGTWSASSKPTRLVFSTTADGASTPTERLFVTSTGRVGSVRNPDATWPSTANVSGQNCAGFTSDGALTTSTNGTTCIWVNRNNADGDLIRFYSTGTQEGAISVSGTTVTYGGGHLARWSQLPNDEDPSSILKGTVMSNLDEMCQWGDEDNEQLNKTKISDVEGDPNVAGVFVSTSFDEEGPSDFFVAMTGDMVIRIAEGVTVERGDLLMSAGDGTAKPQDDDIIRSKTIAKVTSTNVSCTYDDGSYCVPCVLMAC